MNKAIVISLLFISMGAFSQNWKNGVWNSDNGDGTFNNPILQSDYSDPDVCQAGEDFYMTASSFNCVPGLPILHSTDLVNWNIISYALPVLYDTIFNKPKHGDGVWAPAIRYHNNEFYIYWGDPDFGVYMVKAQNAKGPWSKPLLIHGAKGWIDPCPFWDEDGKAYLVHAFAGSRAGVKSILVINEMSPDGTSINPQPVLVFDGHKNHRVVEGPKMYKRNGYYYIFAPAGGVKPGWQLVLRSKNVYGPYEEKIVLHQGNTNINGPHQGGYLELESGESWFIHFQDQNAYGRVVHLNPVNWVYDWPLMGVDVNKDGIGEPVSTFHKPKVNAPSKKISVSTSDEFNSPFDQLQWQWHTNPKHEWSFATANGFRRMNCVLQPENDFNLWDIPNLYLQKLPAREFTVSTKFKFYPMQDGDQTALVIMGEDYAYIACEQIDGKTWITYNTCKNSSAGTKEVETERVEIDDTELYFKVEVADNGKCYYSYSTNGKKYNKIGEPFTALAGRWIGAKVGIFSLKTKPTNDSGYADYDWFRFK